MSWIKGQFKRKPKGSVRYRYKKKTKTKGKRLTLDDLDNIFTNHLRGIIND